MLTPPLSEKNLHIAKASNYWKNLSSEELCKILREVGNNFKAEALKELYYEAALRIESK